MLAPSLIIVWPSTNDTIPSGFVRETLLDGKFPKGAAVAANPNTTGGSATHSHTSPTHSHALNSHTHTFSLDSALQSGSTDSTGPSNNIMVGGHTHTGTSDGPTGGTTSQNAVTYGAFSNNPPYYEAIFIKSNGYQGIPDDAVLFLNGDDVPSGFSNFSSLHGKYLKGASSLGDSGATGGSTTNVHNISHTHSANTHTHSATSGNQLGNSSRRSGGVSVTGIDNAVNHTHSLVLSASTEPIDAYSSSLTTAEVVQPAYTKLRPIQNTSGATKLAQKKMIALYLGNLSTIPAGWKLCDGSGGTIDMRGRHLKCSTTDTETGGTGGSNTHTHAAQAHTHTSIGSHSHASASGEGLAHINGENPQGSGSVYDQVSHVHSLTAASSSSNPGYASANTTADSSDNQPEFRTVLFLEFDFMIGGGALLALL